MLEFWSVTRFGPLFSLLLPSYHIGWLLEGWRGLQVNRWTTSPIKSPSVHHSNMLPRDLSEFYIWEFDRRECLGRPKTEVPLWALFEQQLCASRENFYYYLPLLSHTQGNLLWTLPPPSKRAIFIFYSKLLWNVLK